MMCTICGQKGAKTRYVSRSYGRGEDLLVIENVPVISCPSCGESYLRAETLHEIDRIRRERSHLAIERSVSVASLGVDGKAA